VAPKSDVFIVKSNDINVEVYGTEFNFKNFPEDQISDVVLVEGSVGIVLESSEKMTKLVPGQLGKVNKENLDVQTERINTKIYTSWINGEVVFRNEKFSQILLKLQRLYNVTIINNKKDKDDLFNASIDLDDESIEEVLSYFKEIYNIEYQIFNNKIIIK
jgi:ferric-dicitrate binding protein FerR (iron transport regulator)